MASFPIIDRYKAYKEGTNHVVRWLTQSASKCSSATSFFQDLERKATAHGAAHSGSEHCAISLSAQDLITLAEFAASDLTVHIPKAVLEVARSVIAGREFCAKWYQANEKDQPTADSEGHVFFIKVLKHVHDLLFTAQESRGPDPRQTPDKDEPKDRQAEHELQQDNFENLFRCLQVEEPGENPLGTTTRSVEGLTTSEKLTFKLEKQKGDKVFAIWCLLEDFNAIKKFVCRIWSEYVAGKKSLRAAGAITDAAFGLMRRANAEFAKTHKDISTYYKMIDFLISNEVRSAKEPGVFKLHDGVLSQAILTLPPDERLCHNSMALFFALRDLFSIMREKMRTEKNGTMIGTRVDTLFQVGDFGAMLLKIAPGIYNIAHDVSSRAPRKNKRGSMECRAAFDYDEYLTAVMEYALNEDLEQLPIWLVAASQTYMEIYNVMGGKVSCALGELRTTYRQMKEDAEKVVKYWSDVGMATGKDAPWYNCFKAVLDPENHDIWDSAVIAKTCCRPDERLWKIPRSKLPTLPNPKTFLDAVCGLQHKSDLLNAIRETVKSVNHLGWSPMDTIDIVLRTLTTKIDKSSSGGRARKPAALTPIDLLEAMEKHSVLADPTNNFNYMNFFKLCMTIDEKLEYESQPGQDNVSPNKLNPFVMVDIFLWEAGDAVTRSPSQDPKTLKAVLAKTNFGRAIGELHGYYQAAGHNKFSKAAFDRSSGHIPKRLRPNVGSTA